ncbi:MAG: hypothetical protein IJP89_06105 [Synergistaceae bacterium]|nr:hypothetical protein [Synergistaceae bacterium]
MTENRPNLSWSGWDKDIHEIVQRMRASGVKEFTISDGSCGMTRTLAVYEANGAKLIGLTQVIGTDIDINTFEVVPSPAFLMRLE